VAEQRESDAQRQCWNIALESGRTGEGRVT
jgi:hypothetical protein